MLNFVLGVIVGVVVGVVVSIFIYAGVEKYLKQVD